MAFKSDSDKQKTASPAAAVVEPTFSSEEVVVVNQQTIKAGERVRKNYPASADYQRTLAPSAEDAAAAQALETELANLPVAQDQWRAPDGRTFARSSITSVEIPVFRKVRATDRIRIWQGAGFTDVVVVDPITALRELT